MFVIFVCGTYNTPSMYAPISFDSLFYGEGEEVVKMLVKLPRKDGVKAGSK